MKPLIIALTLVTGLAQAVITPGNFARLGAANTFTNPLQTISGTSPGLVLNATNGSFDSYWTAAGCSGLNGGDTTRTYTGTGTTPCGSTWITYVRYDSNAVWLGFNRSAIALDEPLFVPGGSSLTWINENRLRSDTFRAHTVYLEDSGGSPGILFDHTTDGTLQILTRAAADSAIIKTNTFNATGGYSINGTTGKTGTACTAFTSGLCTTATEPNPLETKIQDLQNQITELRNQIELLRLK